MNQPAFCIFIDTVCERQMPAWHDGKGFPVVYPSIEAAQREIADDVMEKLRQFIEGDRDFEDAMEVEDYILPVDVLPDGSGASRHCRYGRTVKGISPLPGQAGRAVLRCWRLRRQSRAGVSPAQLLRTVSSCTRTVPFSMKMEIVLAKKIDDVLLHKLPREKFLRVWNCVAYLFPGLHPDGFEDADSGWPRVVRRFAAEAWQRLEDGELSEEELYPCDAQWCGLYDRMHKHEPDEIDRRLALAADFGEPLNA